MDNPDLRWHKTFDLDWGSTQLGFISSAIAASGIARGFLVKGGADVSWSSTSGLTSCAPIEWAGWPFQAQGWSMVWQSVEARAELLAQVADAEDGDLLLVGVGDARVVNTALGRLRAHVAKQRDLIPEDTFAFVWVTDFPAFEKDEDNDRWVAVHHPFTKPLDEHIEWLGTDRMGEILSDAYDIVCNGYEIGGGSIRIHNAEVQRKVFEALGLSMDEAPTNSVS